MTFIQQIENKQKKGSTEVNCAFSLSFFTHPFLSFSLITIQLNESTFNIPHIFSHKDICTKYVNMLFMGFFPFFMQWKQNQYYGSCVRCVSGVTGDNTIKIIQSCIISDIFARKNILKREFY